MAFENTYIKGQQSDSVGARSASTMSAGGVARHSGTIPHSATRPPHSFVSAPFVAEAPDMYRAPMCTESDRTF